MQFLLNCVAVNSIAELTKKYWAATLCSGFFYIIFSYNQIIPRHLGAYSIECMVWLFF
jgi:hypothetical protein